MSPLARQDKAKVKTPLLGGSSRFCMVEALVYKLKMINPFTT